jgi:NTE family protein
MGIDDTNSHVQSLEQGATDARIRSGFVQTAFVFAGGGSLGAVQAGMLRELTRRGVSADFVVGSSVGAMNASYFASAPNPAGIEKLGKIWRALCRHDVFPASVP